MRLVSVLLSAKKMVDLKVVPNILIATDNHRAFEQIKSFVQLLTGINSYTVYKLDSKDLSKSNVWFNYCKLLIQPVLSQESVSQAKLVKEFIRSGGRVLTVPTQSQTEGSSLKTVVKLGDDTIKATDDAFDFEAAYQNDQDLTKTPAALASVDELNDEQRRSLGQYIYHYGVPESGGLHGVIRIPLSLDEPIKEVAKRTLLIRIYAQVLEDVFQVKCASLRDLHSLEAVGDEALKENYLLFSKNELLQSVKVVEEFLRGSLNKNATLRPQQKGAFDKPCNFNAEAYFAKLTTKSYGHVVMFADLVGSTMNAFDVMPSAVNNLLVIARQQVKGQGANKNEWLSPIGCCMFTLYLNLNSNNFNPARLCLLQFAAALSCVKAIRKTPGLENLPVKLKWPNDIFFERKLKLGGILVRSSMIGSQQSVKIGVGFNLDNSHPTNCLNSELRRLGLPEWTNEEFISKFVNEFERLIDQLSSAKHDLNLFLDEYCQHWLHTDQRVVFDASQEEAQVTGINEYGYLRVKKLKDGSEIDLQPDGNRFDMMQNLIVLR